MSKRHAQPHNLPAKAQHLHLCLKALCVINICFDLPVCIYKRFVIQKRRMYACWKSNMQATCASGHAMCKFTMQAWPKQADDGCTFTHSVRQTEANQSDITWLSVRVKLRDQFMQIPPNPGGSVRLSWKKTTGLEHSCIPDRLRRASAAKAHVV